jgi:hypothetical protein
MSDGDREPGEELEQESVFKKDVMSAGPKQGGGHGGKPSPQEVDKLADTDRWLDDRCRQIGPECTDPLTNGSMSLSLGLLAASVNSDGLRKMKGTVTIPLPSSHRWFKDSPKQKEKHQAMDVTQDLALSSIKLPPPYGSLASAMKASIRLKIDSKQHTEAFFHYEFVDSAAKAAAHAAVPNLASKVRTAIHEADDKIQQAMWQQINPPEEP